MKESQSHLNIYDENDKYIKNQKQMQNNAAENNTNYLQMPKVNLDFNNSYISKFYKLFKFLNIDIFKDYNSIYIFSKIITPFNICIYALYIILTSLYCTFYFTFTLLLYPFPFFIKNGVLILSSILLVFFTINSIKILGWNQSFLIKQNILHITPILSSLEILVISLFYDKILDKAVAISLFILFEIIMFYLFFISNRYNLSNLNLAFKIFSSFSLLLFFVDFFEYKIFVLPIYFIFKIFYSSFLVNFINFLIFVKIFVVFLINLFSSSIFKFNLIMGAEIILSLTISLLLFIFLKYKHFII